MAAIVKPFISNLTLGIDKDTANADVQVDYDLNWSNVDQLTNLVYDERWELVGDEIAVVVTMTPKLPVAKASKSALVLVDAL